MQQALITMLNVKTEREATRAQAEEECKRQYEEQRRLEEWLHHQEEKEKELLKLRLAKLRKGDWKQYREMP